MRVLVCLDNIGYSPKAESVLRRKLPAAVLVGKVEVACDQLLTEMRGRL